MSTPALVQINTVYLLSNTKATFETKLMEKLINNQAGMKKSFAYKDVCIFHDFQLRTCSW